MIEMLTVEDVRAPERSAWVCVELTGDVDIASTWDFPEQVRAALPGPGTVVVVDASAVTFIDAFAVSVLLVVRARLRAEGHDLVLGECSGAVRWILHMLDLADELAPLVAATS